jgi:DtxR family Mn-dependent transcriptional regulator
VSDHDPALLRYLGELGLYPGAEVQVVGAAPFTDSVTVRLGALEHTLGREAAQHVFVTKIMD